MTSATTLDGRASARLGYQAAYATSDELCAIFQADKSALYPLALLLTADHQKAEAVFAAALDECLSSYAVFQGWARSWARRAIAKNAIKLMQPVPGEESAAADVDLEHSAMQALLALPAFDRFAFVLSVLERYPDRECAVLLNASVQDVARARERAMRRLARIAEETPTFFAGRRLDAGSLPAAGAA